MKKPKVWDSPEVEVIYEYVNDNKVWMIVSKFEYTPTPAGYQQNLKKETRYCVGVIIQAQDEVEFHATFGSKDDAFRFLEDVRYHRGRFVTKYNVMLKTWSTVWEGFDNGLHSYN